jgi:hypothetical protein
LGLGESVVDDLLERDGTFRYALGGAGILLLLTRLLSVMIFE